MTTRYGWMTATTAAAVCFGLFLAAPGRGQDSAADKARQEAKAKRNAKNFENNATVITLFDREGKQVGTVGERALYDDAVFSPDRKRLAVITENLDAETADLFVLDAATGKSTRMTAVAKDEFVGAVAWSPDGSELVYATMRDTRASLYRRASSGEGPETLLYSDPGAFLGLSDWSADGRFLVYTKSDLGGGGIYVLPLGGSGPSTPIEVFHTTSRVFDARFSPDGRFLSYVMNDPKEPGKNYLYVRPFDPSGAAAAAGPWKLTDNERGQVHWRRDGKELYFLTPDRSVQVVDVSTSPSFQFQQPRTLFRPAGSLPLVMSEISPDGERFVAFPPPRGMKLQQITMYDREGKVARKLGDPDLYGQPSFSPDGTRILVVKSELNTGQNNFWTFEIATGKATQITHDPRPKGVPMWSRDGKQIYFVSTYISPDGGNFTGVYRMPADGSGDRELLFHYTAGAGLNLTDISPDGKFLACASGGVLLIVPLTGSDPLAREAIEFEREEYSVGTGRFSPDGRFIAYVSSEVDPDRNEVFVREFNPSTGRPGEGKWQLSKAGAAGMEFWRADGKEFLYRQFVEPGAEDFGLMSASVNTTGTFSAETPKVLFKLPGPIGGNLGDISPDAKLVVFAQQVPADQH